jgi:TolA-binding protein
MAVRRIALATLVFSLTGCFFPAERGRLLESRVDALSDDNKKLRDGLKETQGRLDETTARLQQALDQLDQASRTTGANIGVKVDSAIQDLAALRGQMETVQYKQGELDTKVQALADRPAATPTSTKPDEPKKEELKRPDDPREFLKLADDKVKSDVELSRRLYTEFMKKWPRDELVGEAHFGLGETWFTDGKCREALYEFGKVIQEFAKTKSAPLAYLQSSDCFNQLKMASESKMMLEELVKQFPKSEQAKTAKTKLADLNKKKK